MPELILPEMENGDSDVVLVPVQQEPWISDRVGGVAQWKHYPLEFSFFPSVFFMQFVEVLVGIKFVCSVKTLSKVKAVPAHTFIKIFRWVIRMIFDHLKSLLYHIQCPW